MSSNRSKSGPSNSSSNAIDVSQHPGFVNLGNTCFLNSALQAISATQSLKHLYQPTEEEIAQQQEHLLQKLQLQSSQSSLTPAELTPAPTPGPSSRRGSVVPDLIDARCKSPVLRLADEENGRIWGQSISRPGSTSIEASSIRALASQAVCNPTPADIQHIQQSRKNSIEAGKHIYEPQSKDIPLNTAFRQVMEKSWDPANRRHSSSKTFIKPSKVASINPKPLLKEISTRFDQYGEYRQQDGHELLRHLLDSLRMEELDVIKKIQPPKSKEKRRKNSSSQNQEVQNSYPMQNGGPTDQQTDNLKPLVDNLFCGKLLSFVVCEGCRHVSHTYEDFYDISLSLRPETDAKDSGKRQRIRSMAERWRRSASNKANGSNSKDEISKPLADSLAMLLDGQSGSYSDTEQSDDPIKRSNSRIGRGISRPRSTADRARIDANSKEGSKTFIKKQMESLQADQSDTEAGLEKAMEKISLGAPPEKKRESVSLLRAVSGRRTPASRAASPLRRDPLDADIVGSSSPAIRSSDTESGSDSILHHRNHLRFGGHHKKKVPSKHAKYLSSLLTEAAPPPQQANIGALFWGRSRTPMVNDSSFEQKGASSEDWIAQQAGTGLVKALHQFTSVEVLDGSNSFACKRCWRLLNPPSAEEDQRLRLRRLRRGKGEHDSEQSSDDESSSDEEAKEERQKAALKSSIRSSTNGSSASSLASDSDTPFTNSSLEGSIEDLVQDENAAINNVSATNTNDGTTPSVVVSEEAQTGSETPKRSTTMIMPPPPKRESTLKASDLSTLTNPSATPKLQAPKPVVGSLRLGKALSPSTSSDEGAGSNQPSSDDSSDEENAKVSSENGSLQRSIRYADEGTSSITKPAAASTNQSAIRRKRSLHSLQRRALKRFLIAETPKVFVFHFKRFQATGRGFSFSTSFKKIDDYVSFPEYLDVKPWLAPPREEYDRHGKLKASSDSRALLKAQQEAEAQIDQDQKHHHHHHHHWGWRPHLHQHDQENKAGAASDIYQPKTKYRLYAVVVHQGSMSGGHYTAYVLSDRASESLKARADAHFNATESEKASSSSKEKLTKNAISTSSGASTNGESSLTASSTPSPRTTDGISNGGNTQLDSSSSVSSLGSEMGERDGEHGAKETTFNTDSKPDERRWIYASDTLVKPASIEEVLKAQAYMLFYEQM